MLDWAAEHFRLTAFGHTFPGDAWMKITGDDPETSTVDRRANTSEHQGDFRDFRLVAADSAGRYDWRIGPQVPAGALDVPLINLASGKEAIDAVAREVFAQDVAPVRLAFGTVLYAKADSREDGYRKLQKVLRNVTLDPAASDFSYQINWPRESKVVPGIKLNRVTTWSVEFRVLNRFMVGPDNHGTPIQVGPGLMDHRCRLMLDLSTDAARIEPLPAGSALRLWEELGALALEIAQNGEAK